ncbi:hypothetical protein C8A01DRAFT_38647 [Parachaetomium inaequale]|uniref:Uncharacterized protein n=1 Tax=Parachaetomium inaequale TaxID=2588326 RepID=A0AAN6PEG6_9PEZI|nr:hypothetical protein C8A01DRAFT_38647 [Parachaetomium inaequale]
MSSVGGGCVKNPETGAMMRAMNGKTTNLLVGGGCPQYATAQDRAKEEEAPGHQQLSRMNNRFDFITDELREIDNIGVPQKGGRMTKLEKLEKAAAKEEGGRAFLAPVLAQFKFITDELQEIDNIAVPQKGGRMTKLEKLEKAAAKEEGGRAFLAPVLAPVCV